MRDSIQIRPAQPGDAEVATVLLYSAYTHTHVNYPPREALGGGFVERLGDFFRRGDNRFSFQNVQVAVQGSEVVGLVLSFGGREEARLNAAVASWLEREAADDEWYVDALAVLENRSRQGIGTRLMHVAEREARKRHYPKIALNVALGNKEAEDLYAHLHYMVMRQTSLYGHAHARMVKVLESGDQ
jgi:ribosomal protein S18 acetylase RimI-like enzyme